FFPCTHAAFYRCAERPAMTVQQKARQHSSGASRYSIPPAELEKGCSRFERYEGRDSVYRVATFLLEKWWGRPAEMADALIVMLLAWNAPFYKYGLFNHDPLEKFLALHWDAISSFRDREVTSLTDADRAAIRR